MSLLLLVFTGTVAAQKQKELEYKVKTVTSIREIAKETTGEPDLWEMILLYNNLKSPVDVVTGIVLKIPVENVKKTRAAVDEASKLIQLATDEGAKILAQEEINKASVFLNDARERRKVTDWKGSLDAAENARQLAQQALKLSREKRTVTGSAVLSYKKGGVENKKGNETSWKPSDLLASFIENERVRTLAASLAEIQFQDNSKIKLNENSQVTIQQNKVDLLKSKTESSVKIEKGDAFALLGGNSAKKKFKVSIPGVESNIKSKSFWVNRDNNNTKLANYDGEIELTSKNGKKVSVKENQGSTISDNGNITAPKDLLKSPLLLQPGNADTILSVDYSFEWEKVPGASKYWVMIASDNVFKKILVSDKAVSGTSFKTKLDPGYYYWRVAAVDKDGFPGPFSDKREALLSLDTEAPYLMINNPVDGFLTAEAMIEVSGEVETGATLSINNNPLKSTSNGKFTYSIKLVTGPNVILAVALDKAGNKSEVKRTVFYNSGSSVPLVYDSSLISTGEKSFITSFAQLRLKGQTIPECNLTFTGTDNKEIKTVSDASGFFMSDINLNTGMNMLSVTLKDKYGKSYSDKVSIELDTLTPVIAVEDFPEALTKEKTGTFAGTVKNSTQFLVNDENIPVTGEKFTKVLQLKEGENRFVIRVKRKNGKQVLLNRVVNCDFTPPQLVGSKVITPKVTNDKRIELSITAEDKSDVARSIRVVYKVGETIYDGTASIVDGKQEYRLSANTSEAAGKSVKIISAILEDILGNVKEYVITPDAQ